MKELLYKLDCKGFSSADMYYYIHILWMIPLFHDGSPYFAEEYRKRLAQAHIEIDFTNYKK